MSTIKLCIPPASGDYVVNVQRVVGRSAGSGTAYDFEFEIAEGNFKGHIIKGSLAPYENYKLPTWLKAILRDDFPEGNEVELNYDLLEGKQVRAKFTNPKVRGLFPM